ncbi:MAG TPA: aldose 1-epimerase [Chitinophagaceae bacterium]|nr:aldose 1-epimerase [Chitinophagaceae bacterium]
MSFQVSRTGQNNTALIHLSDNNHSTAVSVIPAVGAMLHEFIVQVNDQPFNIIDNYQLNRPVREQVTDYFKSIKLSPWVCRMNEGRYNFNGVTYQSKKMHSDGTALHGLLYDQPFTVEDESATANSASVVIKHDYKGYDPGYPFHYTCRVRYTLHAGARLEVETTLINQSNVEIPVADGWHPYFKLGGKVNDWELFYPAKAKLEFNDKLIPTGKMLPFSQFNKPSLIGNTEMDNCFQLAEQACTLRNPANGLKISLLPDAAYPYLQVFIPGHRESIAIENLSSAPDSFNNHLGLVILPPGESRSFRVFYVAGVE